MTIAAIVRQTHEVRGLVDLFQDPNFLVSALVGALVTLVAWFDARRNGGSARIGAGWLATVAVALASLSTVDEWSRYGELPPDDHRLAGFLVALVGALGAFSLLRVRQDGEPRERMLSAAFGVAVLGLFLCIPDTEQFRLIIAPVSGITLLVVLGFVRPFSRLWLFGAALVLSWMGYRDGLERFTAMIGLSACLAAFCLVLLIPRSALPDRLASTPWLGFVPIAAVVLSSRAAGVQPSVLVSAPLAFLIIGGAIFVLRSGRFET